ncbi:hypothetical protein SAMN05444483_12417 [Salegentibacter echinorum]|uniref:Uncharacterized protein n=1 Tax=Salegentibacter echinorum TaxID=1073325 RepID=A0A1M5M3K0_SALEC|nr:hypothetical protein [Salegentibacter echinorum]SHG71845.1 hypothetical protein SAMN05444483_12417 [Salegentibacter echinorum]
MNHSFQDHHDEHEIQMLSIQSEAQQWEERLSLMNEEISFYLDILSSALNNNVSVTINRENAKHLDDELQAINKINEAHLSTFFDYKNKLEGLKECDDVQCENFYLKDHLIFKEKLMQHFKSFRAIKLLIFKYLRLSFS